MIKKGLGEIIWSGEMTINDKKYSVDVTVLHYPNGIKYWYGIGYYHNNTIQNYIVADNYTTDIGDIVVTHGTLDYFEFQGSGIPQGKLGEFLHG